MFTNVLILAAGNINHNDPLKAVLDDYLKRLKCCQITEIKQKKQANILNFFECEKYLKPQDAIIICDVLGKNYSSPELSKILQSVQVNFSRLVFVIGAAEGVDDMFKNKAQMLLSLGKNTWPHKLFRVMLIEQLYRTQQILLNHPYHKN